MNCDSADVDCACDMHEYLAFSEVMTWVNETGEDPYHLHGGCDPCIFFNSFRCAPLRKWAGEWAYRTSNGLYDLAVRSKEGDEEIIRCENFKTAHEGMA